MLARAAVAALVGTRVYPGSAGRNAELPYIVVRKLDNDFCETFDNSGGLEIEEFAIDCKGATQQSAEAVAEACKGFLPTYAGAIGGVTIWGVLLDLEFDHVDQPTGSEEHGRNVTTLQVTVQHSG